MRIPLRRIFDDKRAMVIPVLAGLALNIVVFVVVVYPLGVRARSMDQRAQVAAEQLRGAEREDAAARAMVLGRDRTDSALQSFYKDVLPASQARAREITYLQLQQLARKHDIRLKHQVATADANEKGLLARLRISMDLEGDYEDIRQFIYQLESSSDFVVIDSVGLQDAQTGAPLTLSLMLSTYYRSEPHGA